MQQRPGDPDLLSQRGRASLLEWSYEGAISDFQQALDSNPNSATVLTDLASAYFERAESEQRFSDYGLAYELQSRALEAEPKNPVVLFNRAITSGRLFLFKQCFEDWENYLRVDPRGEWADEARAQFGRVKEQFDAHEHRIHDPLLSPEEFVQTVIPWKPETWAQVEPRIERYLTMAVTDWLPAAFPALGSTSASDDARRALRTLALILQERHGDTWLVDLLPTRPSTEFAKAVAALSRAITENNVTEDFIRGRQESIRAAELFERMDNRSGMLRAEFEEIYSLRFSDAFSLCLQRVRRLTPQVLTHSYLWLRVQLNLEEYNCWIGSGQLGRTLNLGSIAYNAASVAQYPYISLRALGFLAVDEREKGRDQHAWSLCRDGLSQFWSGSVDPTPGYNFYVHVSELAQDGQRWHLGLAVEEQALSLLDRNETPLVRAVEYMHLAQAALMVGAAVKAKGGLAAAEQLLSSAPQTEVTENYRLKVEIEMSRIDAQNGGSDSAVNRLLALQPRLATLANWYTVADYYEALGDLQKARRQTAGAAAAYEKAVAVVELQRSSIRSDRDRVSWARQSVNSYRKLTEISLQTENPVGSLSTWELYRSAALRTRTSLPASVVAGSDFQDQLQASLAEERAIVNRRLSSLGNETVLVFVVLSDGVAVWIHDDKGLAALRIERNAADVQMLAERIEELCANPSSTVSAIQVVAKQLYQILIAPVANRLRPARTLVVETDDALAGVPFQTLMDSRGNYLLDSHPVIYSPGFHYLASAPTGSMEVTSKMRALVVEGLVGDRDMGLDVLDEAATEADAVAKRFPDARLLKASEWSLEAIRNELQQAEVFHFVGHTATSASRTGLLLASKGKRENASIFDSSVLDGIFLPSLRLVALSACSTEKGTERSTLDPEGLARAFLRAGASHVIATRWNVDSEATSAVMQLFYDSLLSGRQVPDALAAAEIEMRRREAHPYYWAAFDAVGR